MTRTARAACAARAGLTRLATVVAFGAIAAISRPLSAQDAQKPTFSTRAEFVRVDALVTNRGESIAGLKAEDFELRDNGVLQNATLMETAALPVDVALALDVSDSMRGAPLANVQQAATALVDSLRKGDRVSLISFNDLLTIHAPLTDDVTGVRAAITQMASGGFTPLRDAAYAALMQSDPDSGRSLVVVFTDGEDLSSWLSDAALIDSAKRTNAVIYSVLLSPGGKPPLKIGTDSILDDLPALTGGRRLSADQPGKLREVFASIVREFRQRYILSYIPNGVDRRGYHALDVRLKNRKGEVRARPGYFRSS